MVLLYILRVNLAVFGWVRGEELYFSYTAYAAVILQDVLVRCCLPLPCCPILDIARIFLAMLVLLYFVLTELGFGITPCYYLPSLLHFSFWRVWHYIFPAAKPFLCLRALLITA